MANIGRLTVKIDANTAGLKTGLNEATSATENSSKAIIGHAKAIGAAFAAYVSVDMFTGMIKGAAEAGRQIDQLSKLSATSAANFQAQAYAAQQFGISNEKLADIFKDVQDKVGDFMQNGAGPLTDFFNNIAPKVGITADEFRNLSGPDALQLYVSSLEKANLTQSEMTFYLEAIANDAAMLLPLLKNNGREMARLGDEAKSLGAILSDETIEANRNFAVQIDRLNSLTKTLSISIGSTLIPEVNKLIEQFVVGMKTAGGFWSALRLIGTSRPFDNPALGAKHYREELERLGKERDKLIEREGIMANTSGYDREIEQSRKLLEYHTKLMQTGWNLSGERMGMNDPRIVGKPAAADIAGYRAPPAAIAAGAATAKPDTSAADEAMRRAQEIDAFFQTVTEDDRKREVERLKSFVDGLNARAEALRQASLNEYQIAEEKYALEAEQLLKAKETFAMSEEEYTERLLQIRMDRDEAIMNADIAMLDHEQRIADERVRINQDAERAIMSAKMAAASEAVNLLGMLGGKSKAAAIAAIALGKGLAIAQVIQNTAVAQMRALAELGPLAGPAAAAKIGMYGKVQAGIIAATGLVQAASVGSGGGGIGGSVTAGNASSNAPATSGLSQTITIQGMSSGDLFSGDAVRTLIDKLIDAQRNGARIVLA
jgi:hypothetical protein